MRCYLCHQDDFLACLHCCQVLLPNQFYPIYIIIGERRIDSRGITVELLMTILITFMTTTYYHQKRGLMGSICIKGIRNTNLVDKKVFWYDPCRPCAIVLSATLVETLTLLQVLTYLHNFLRSMD